jgi:FkbM family methyltransferase
MTSIYAWLRETLGGPEDKVIIEAGAYKGEDTAILAALPGVRVYALEPDPGNLPDRPLGDNVSWHTVAVGARSGTREFWPSRSYHGKPWCKSGSLLRPTGHLERYPAIKFGELFEVEVTTLDDFAVKYAIDEVAFQWWDVQGAEGEAVEGGQEVLARTRFLYTEHCGSAPVYDGQPPLDELLAMLPDWRVIATWPTDILLERAG